VPGRPRRRAARAVAGSSASPATTGASDLTAWHEQLGTYARPGVGSRRGWASRTLPERSRRPGTASVRSGMATILGAPGRGPHERWLRASERSATKPAVPCGERPTGRLGARHSPSTQVLGRRGTRAARADRGGGVQIGQPGEVGNRRSCRSRPGDRGTFTPRCAPWDTTQRRGHRRSGAGSEEGFAPRPRSWARRRAGLSALGLDRW